MDTDVFTSSGTWTAPANVFEAIVEVWGAGGQGRTGALNVGGGGGGGGAYARSVISVTPMTGYTVTVGAGGTGNGGDSWFGSDSTVFAAGGNGGGGGNVGHPGGSGGSSIGDFVFSGGSGGVGTSTPSNNSSGGGGAGAGTSNNGADGAAGDMGSGGGTGANEGGSGGSGGVGLGVSGNPGSAPGGAGGGGGGAGGSVGGDGARGEVRITYTERATPAVVSNAATDIGAHSFTANGEITVIGASTVTKRGFVYDTVSHDLPDADTIDDTDYAFIEDESGSFSAEEFDLPITGLDDETTYYYRAAAENSEGAGFGEEIEVVTFPAPVFVMSPTGNITDGEATTAQMTPPSGKTTGDFTAGTAHDETSLTDPIDIGDDEYTEIEFAIEATIDAEDDETYEFRITRDGELLDTYSETPEWTIISGAEYMEEYEDSVTMEEMVATSAAFSRGLPDTFAIAEFVSNNTTLSTSESLDLVFAMAKDVDTIRIDSIDIEDFISKHIDKLTEDEFELLEDVVVLLVFLKELDDMVEVAEQDIKDITLSKVDSVDIDELISQFLDILRSLGDEVGVAEDISLEVGFLRNLLDSFALIEVLSNTTTLSASELLVLSMEMAKSVGTLREDMVDINELAVKIVGKPLDDEVEIVEDILALLTFVHNISDAVELFEDVNKDIGVFKDDSVVVEEDMTPLRVILQELLDDFAVIEAHVKEYLAVKTDSVDVAEVLYRGVLSDIADSIELVEEIIKYIGLNKFDVVDIAENIATLNEFLRELDDVLAVTETISNQSTLSVSESLPIATTIVKLINTYWDDDVEPTEVVERLLGRFLLDDVDVVEDMSMLFAFVREMIDSATMAEELSKYMGLVRLSSVEMQEAVDRSLAFLRELEDDTEIVENILLNVYILQQLQDTFEVIEAYFKDYAAYKEEQFDIEEERYSDIGSDIEDSIETIESLIKLIGGYKVDDFDVTEEIITLSEFLRDLNDSFAVAETLANQSSLSLGESLPFVFAIVKTINIYATEDVDVVDMVVRLWGRYLSDDIEMAENMATLLSFIRELEDFVDLIDATAKDVWTPRDDTVELTEEFDAILFTLQVLHDTIELLEEHTKDYFANKYEDLGIEDNFSAAFATYLEDTLEALESLIKEIGLNKADTVDVQEQMSLLNELLRHLFDVVPLVEALANQKTVSLSELLDVTVAMFNFIELDKADDVGVDDTLLRWLGRELDDEVEIEELLTKASTKNVSDTFELAYLVHKYIGKVLVEDESISLSEMMTRTLSVIRLLQDNVDIDEQMIFGSGLLKDLLDSVMLIEALYKNIGVDVQDEIEPSELLVIDELLVKVLHDMFELIDELENSYNMGRADILDILEHIYASVGKNIDDNVELTDALTRLFGRGLFSTIGILDAISKQSGVHISDVIDLLDTIDREAEFYRGFDDIIDLVDALSLEGLEVLALFDAFVLNEVMQVMKDLSDLELEDILNVSDVIATDFIKNAIRIYSRIASKYQRSDPIVIDRNDEDIYNR